MGVGETTVAWILVGVGSPARRGVALILLLVLGADGGLVLSCEEPVIVSCSVALTD